MILWETIHLFYNELTLESLAEPHLILLTHQDFRLLMLLAQQKQLIGKKDVGYQILVYLCLCPLVVVTLVTSVQAQAQERLKLMEYGILWETTPHQRCKYHLHTDLK